MGAGPRTFHDRVADRAPRACFTNLLEVEHDVLTGEMPVLDRAEVMTDTADLHEIRT